MELIDFHFEWEVYETHVFSTTGRRRFNTVEVCLHCPVAMENHIEKRVNLSGVTIEWSHQIVIDVALCPITDNAHFHTAPNEIKPNKYVVSIM